MLPPKIFPPKKTLRHLQHQTSSAGLSSSHFGVIALAALVQFPKANGKDSMTPKPMQKNRDSWNPHPTHQLAATTPWTST